ncbi:hypothetical protein [Nocardioides zeae]|uniref:DUF4232 domain-containing protein n=1 Tax=Nocardioides zeae TaxID=1457234 RepID=A0AAJ1X177_9ACTN|nr:hypothetical protein [Nocardioides zeae]MDQ1105323.1 hypothetical protein [Nocardioides zeae]
MSAVSRPRGPLSPRVYWRRRIVLAAVAALLVVLVGRLLGAGSDGDGDEARPAASDASTTTDQPSSAASAPPPTTTTEAPPPATPEGRCAADDVAVRAKVERAVAGQPVAVTLLFSSKETPACYWTASPTTTVVKITSGSDDIWSTQHCPDALPEQELVLRTDAEAAAELEWPAWRSGPGCELEQWSLPGAYHVESAALAGEPTDVQFELETPQPEVIERTITPTADPTAPSGSASASGTTGTARPAATTAPTD